MVVVVGEMFDGSEQQVVGGGGRTRERHVSIGRGTPHRRATSKIIWRVMECVGWGVAVYSVSFWGVCVALRDVGPHSLFKVVPEIGIYRLENKKNIKIIQ